MSVDSLHVLGSRQFGGADQFYVRLVEALNGQGHRAAAVNRPGSPVAGALAASGTEQYHLPLANKWDLASALRLRALVRRLQPAVVQTYMGRATRLTRLPRRGRAVHVARLGGYYKIRGYYEHAHAWVGNTRGVCDYLVRAGLPADRVFRIGNFVPEPEPVTTGELAALRASLGIPAEAWTLFTLGRFIDIKGFDDLLDALALLREAPGGRPVHLLIAGDGPLAGSLRAQCAALGLEGRVHWLGWQDRPSRYFSLADVLVCPSRHETLGNVILEGWSHHKPVVSTTTPGGLELIEADVNGLLCPVADPAALAGRLRELLEAPEADRRRLADTGRATVEAHHRRAAVVQSYLDLYAELAARRRQGRA